jgi:hypothetical protein
VHDDCGSSVVEFVMISSLLVLLLFAVLQVAALFYVRSVVGAATADAARYAANSGIDSRSGGARAALLIRDGLGPGMARQLQCEALETADPASGLSVVQVGCRGRMRSLLLPVAGLVTVSASSRSLKEGP